MIGRHPIPPRRTSLEQPVPPAVETGRSRLLIAGAMFAVAFAMVAGRLVDVTLFADGNEPRLAQSTGETSHHTDRADIVDRNGVLLATSLKTASLYADARVVLDADEAARKLATVLPDLDIAKVRRKLMSDRAFIWIRRHLTPRQQNAVNRLGIPGLDFLQEERRVYPAGPLVSHIVGHTDIDNRGLVGIERAFDRALGRKGTPLQLSIDLRVQHAMHAELSSAMETFQAIGGAGIVMDVNSGEVLSLVSLPTFDPNKPMAIGKEARFNRATLGVYEMGSTFKIFNTAMALDTGRITLGSGYDAKDPIRIARFVIRDFHAKRRWLSVPEIFMYSSNIGSVKMALDVGPIAQQEFMRRIGMLRPSPVELPEVGSPLVPNRWREINAMTISFGHGISVSPMQLVSGVASMVNGGVRRNPTLIHQPDGERPKGTRVISAATSEKIRRLMRLVVENGTGKNAAADGMLVGGKTGTAEKVVGRRYKTKALMSSFIGAFPMTAPRYVVFAMLDEPTGTKETFGYATGGWVAAPVVGKVIARIGPMLGVDPVDPASEDIRRRMAVNIVTEKDGRRQLASF
jgi:cell division protein FtsI (penicillin-binding protein 3)